MKTLVLSPERRQRLVDELCKLASQDFDIALSPFQAGELVDRMTALIVRQSTMKLCRMCVCTCSGVLMISMARFSWTIPPDC
ncbi:hypothetical protein BBF93_16965 [Hyphomonas sp. CACIAM 19H1]|uniref:hypothetical protein n=1 Tax=Hyphomonas sp. CACIAM 19H1 TaxID=1873716 RepID=UPI000DF0A792|nr:hypothetical protein BBF93_16965 [Hyphomonas sp. CACIAM 19H1]